MCVEGGETVRARVCECVAERVGVGGEGRVEWEEGASPPRPKKFFKKSQGIQTPERKGAKVVCCNSFKTAVSAFPGSFVSSTSLKISSSFCSYRFTTVCDVALFCHCATVWWWSVCTF